MKFKTKYKINLYKAYFDTGLALTSYAKYLIAFFGLATLNLKYTFIFAIIYAIVCFFLGWWWIRKDFLKAQIEVGNRFNLFVKEMRKEIGSSKNRKV